MASRQIHEVLSRRGEEDRDNGDGDGDGEQGEFETHCFVAGALHRVCHLRSPGCRVTAPSLIA
jgi:hypothetical protein